MADHTGRTPTTFHPKVHYIFADDDDSVLASALEAHGASLDASTPDTGSSSPPGLAPDSRAVIVDLKHNAAGDGYEIAWASSLSPRWAVTSAQLTPMSADGPAGPGDGGAVMLKVEGVSLDAAARDGHRRPAPPETAEAGESSGSAAPGAGLDEGAAAAEDYASLIEDFEKRMGVLRKVVLASEERDRAVPGHLEEDEKREGAGGNQEEDEDDNEVTQRPEKPAAEPEGADNEGQDVERGTQDTERSI